MIMPLLLLLLRVLPSTLNPETGTTNPPPLTTHLSSRIPNPLPQSLHPQPHTLLAKSHLDADRLAGAALMVKLLLLLPLLRFREHPIARERERRRERDKARTRNASRNEASREKERERER